MSRKGEIPSMYPGRWSEIGALGKETVKSDKKLQVETDQKVGLLLQAFGVKDLAELEVGDGTTWDRIRAVQPSGYVKRAGYKLGYKIDGRDVQFRQKTKKSYVVKTTAEIFPQVAEQVRETAEAKKTEAIAVYNTKDAGQRTALAERLALMRKKYEK